MSEPGGLMDHYILDAEGEPVPVDLLTWARWFEQSRLRIVLQESPARGVRVSTVFLGLDHSFCYSQPHVPVLWETMIFGGPFDQFQDRYSSRLDALRGHAFAVALVELYRAVPRKTKQALQKSYNSWRSPAPRLRPLEQRRLQRALTRIGWRAS